MVLQEIVLTPQECSVIVKGYLQSEEFEVLHYQENVLADCPGEAILYSIIIKISFNNTIQEVKLIGKHLGNNSQFLTKDDFAKEIFSHEFLFNAFKNKNEAFNLNFTPKCYFAKTDTYILFENPFDQGFVFPENSNISIDHTKLVLKTLANYHAGCIVYEETKSQKVGKQYRLEDKYDILKKGTHILERKWFQAKVKSLNALIDLLPQDELTHQEFKEKLNKIATDYLEKVTSKNAFRHVLCHGYMWGNNVLFKYNNKKEPIECKLMNFELQHYNLPALDVLHFIYSRTTMGIRKRHFHELLQFYYDCLKAELHTANMDANNLISLQQDFELSVHYLLPLIKLQSVCFKQALNYNSEAKSGEDVTLLAAEAFRNNKRFRKIMTESISELKCMVLHPKLSMEDCFKIIANKTGTTNYELINYQLMPLSTISGYLGDHNKLQIDISINNQRKTFKLFAKFLPKTEAAIGIANDTAAFYKEIFMYQNFMPMLKSFGIDLIDDCIVPCYFTRHNDVLIFDDFGNKDYKTLEPRKPFSPDLMQIVIKKMAKYHASSIILEEKLSEQTGTKYCLKDHYPKELQESLFVTDKNHQGGQCIRVGENMIEYEFELLSDPKLSLSENDLKAKVRKAYRTMYDLVKPSKEFRNAVCHGDLWISNILVKHEGELPKDCRFIDFQICRYCPPAQDLLTFVHLATNRSTRKQHFENLINLYYNELATNLNRFGYNIKEIYPRDNFMKSIEYMIPQAVCQTGVYYQLALINNDILKEHTKDEESAKNVLLGDRRDFLADMFKQDPYFTERTHEALQDLQEMCLKYF